MHLQRVGVLGCGLMGHGIAQVAAQAGCDVVVREIGLDDSRFRTHRSKC
jgi:3-hydroxybutyryl-CoA dehydrogenase